MWFGKMCLLASLIQMISSQCSVYVGNQTCECWKPVFMMHGVVSDKYFHLVLEKWIKDAHPGTFVYNSNTDPDLLSTRPCWEQVRGKLGRVFRAFCAKFPCGIIVLAHSQGTVLMRAVIEENPDCNVHTFISLAGPLCGQYGIPDGISALDFGVQLPPLKSLGTDIFYTTLSQSLLSIPGYWRDPHRLEDYYKDCLFLPYIDNEVLSDRSADYKRAIEKLCLIVAIAGPQDGVIKPWQSGFCDFYDENESIIPYYNRTIYTRNTFGLRTLAESGRYITFTRPGVFHVGFLYDRPTFDECILPYLSGHPYPCYNATNDTIDLSPDIF